MEKDNDKKITAKRAVKALYDAVTQGSVKGATPKPKGNFDKGKALSGISKATRETFGPTVATASNVLDTPRKLLAWGVNKLDKGKDPDYDFKNIMNPFKDSYTPTGGKQFAKEHPEASEFIDQVLPAVMANSVQGAKYTAKNAGSYLGRVEHVGQAKTSALRQIAKNKVPKNYAYEVTTT